MTTLFDPSRVGDLDLANRIVIVSLPRNRALATDEFGGAIIIRVRLLVDVMQALAGTIGGGRTGLRLSPVTPSNDAGQDSDPQALFEYAVGGLAPLRLAFVE